MGISLRKLTEREVSRNGQFLVGQDTGSCVAEGDLVVKVMVPSLPLNIGCLLSQPHVLYLCLDCFQFSTQLGFMEIIDCLPCYYQWHLYDFYVVSSPSLSSFPSKKKNLIVSFYPYGSSLSLNFLARFSHLHDLSSSDGGRAFKHRLNSYIEMKAAAPSGCIAHEVDIINQIFFLLSDTTHDDVNFGFEFGRRVNPVR